MDRQITKNLYGWRAFHFAGSSITPIWYSWIDSQGRASSIMDGEPWFHMETPNKPFSFNLHKWNVSDITPAQDMDDEEWQKALPGSRVSLMRATQAGFHSFMLASEAAHYATHNNAEILGKVQLGGRVIEHECGYRSQFMRITELYCEEGSRGSRIADALGWPFELQPFSRAVVQDRGITASFQSEVDGDEH